MSECVNCHNMTYTYRGYCNQCAWEQMHHWKTIATAAVNEKELVSQQMAYWREKDLERG